MNEKESQKKYYYINILGEDNLILYAPSWDSVFIFLINYYGSCTERSKRIIKDIQNIEDKIHIFELINELEVGFASILDNLILMDCADVRKLDEEGNEIE